MAAQTFRSAFNGFNREDVIHHLEYVNNKHTNEINQLKLENEALQAEITLLRSRPTANPEDAAAREVAEALKAENDALRQELDALRARCEEENARPAEVPDAPSTDSELEMYRRAERVEREARERAQQIYRQANGALADATVRVDEAAGQIGELSDRVTAQLAELQTAVTGSKQALRDAAATMYAICPDPDAE